jgi:tryptophan 2,3-dioxygenase
VLRIVKVLVAQMDVLETMTPVEFLSFRARLDSASGFQSVQFRELEFLLGHKQPDAIDRAAPASADRARLEARLTAPTLWDAFLAHLSRCGAAIPSAVLGRDVTTAIEPDAEVQAALVEIYRTDPGASVLCERLVDLDEGLQEWRYRHVKMVERTIGVKPGTGGSPGAAYLRSTVGQVLFPDLWAIRAQL